MSATFTAPCGHLGPVTVVVGADSMDPHGTGRWVACVTVDVIGGLQVRRNRSACTQAEARELLRRFHDEVRAGVVGAKGATLSGFLNEWLDQVLPTRRVSPARIAHLLRHHVEPVLGPTRLGRLRPEHVDSVLRSMAEVGIARSTIWLVRSVLALPLFHAESRDLVLRDTARLSAFLRLPSAKLGR